VGSLLNSGQSVQECDATEAEKIFFAGSIINILVALTYHSSAEYPPEQKKDASGFPELEHKAYKKPLVSPAAENLNRTKD
jgi:hypothetical protein